METWSIWYIDEDFLIWIIPSRYQSHECTYWARTTGFVTSVHLIIWCLTYVRLCMLTTRFSTHAFDLDLSIHVCLTMHATWHSPHYSLGSPDSPGPTCSDLRAWNLWILPVADQICQGSVDHWQTVGTPSFQAPCSSPECSFCNSWASFVLFIIVYLTFVPISDVIFL